MKHKYGLILLLLCTALTVKTTKAQNDTAYQYKFKIQLLDDIGGKYKIYYKGKLIHSFNSRRKLLDTIVLNVDTTSIDNIDNYLVPIEIHKKNFWSLYYSDINLYVYYIRGYSYFTIISSRRVKNRFRFETYIANFRYEYQKID